MVQSLTFKPYNLDAEGKLPPGGYLHPLMKVRTQFREVFLELGFEEMPTDRFVESSVNIGSLSPHYTVVRSQGVALRSVALRTRLRVLSLLDRGVQTGLHFLARIQAALRATSQFWNFDSLFQPQQHQARDAHDTFFVKGAAAETTKLPDDYMKIVEDTHQTGGNTGSIGESSEFPAPRVLGCG